MQYIITDISRKGCEEYCSNNTFKSLEDAVTYIRDVWYDQFCTEFDYPDLWDADDMGCPFPIKDDFRVESITDLIHTRKGASLVIFGPYSKYNVYVPIELRLTITKNKF